jgi:hypothetical protein
MKERRGWYSAIRLRYASDTLRPHSYVNIRNFSHHNRDQVGLVARDIETNRILLGL